MFKPYFILFLLIFISSCSYTINPQDSINKGIQYLKSVENLDLSYKDTYLEYVYPSEKLECPPQNCTLTYRKLDAFFNLIFIKNEFNEYKPLESSVNEANNILESLLPLWREEKLYNIINDSMQKPNGLALDTYCILGYLYNDKQMAVLVQNSLYLNKWLPDNFYGGDQDFRTIADESWCVRLIQKHYKEKIRFVKEKLVQDTYNYLKENHIKITKVNAAIHTLTMLVEFNEPSKDIKYFQDYIANSINDKETWQDTTTLANILDVLILSNYQNKAKIDKIAQELITRQENNGSWLLSKNAPKNFGQVFTTFRVIIALNKYQKWQK